MCAAAAMPYAPGTLRTLLIEFAATDRFHRAVPYPYLVGMAREAGAEVRWFRVSDLYGPRLRLLPRVELDDELLARRDLREWVVRGTLH